MSDACRGEVVAALCVDRQVSDKAQGRKPRAGLGSVIGPARSMGIWRRGVGGSEFAGLLDRGDLGMQDSDGADWRRLWGYGDGSFWLLCGLAGGLRRAGAWPAVAGIISVSGKADGHSLMAWLSGGARAGWRHTVPLGVSPDSKVSMMIMGPPQLGQGWLSASGGVSVSSAGSS